MRGHPTADQAYAALANGQCMYAPLGPCAGSPVPVYLHDGANVLACKAHVGRLRKMHDRDRARLARDLAPRFNPRRSGSRDEPPTLLFV